MQTPSTNTTPATPAVLPGTQDTTARPAPVDQECVDRVEQMLDATELAIDVAQREPVEPPPQAAEKALSVSVVIPVYNERATIREIVDRVRQVGVHHEILIVDDFSTDGTRDILVELDQAADIRLVLHGYNRGKGAALRTAFERVQGDVVIIQDADLEYDPRDYERLLKPIRAGHADVVYGSRFLAGRHQHPSRMHRFGNWLLTWLSNLLTRQQLTDMETCYKVFRCRVLRRIQLEENGFGIEPELTAKVSRMGHRIVEVPIRYNSRGYEQGKKIGIRDGFRAIWCIFRYGLYE